MSIRDSNVVMPDIMQNICIFVELDQFVLVFHQFDAFLLGNEVEGSTEHEQLPLRLELRH